MEPMKKNKRPPWWFALAVWSGVAGAAGVMALAIGAASS